MSEEKRKYTVRGIREKMQRLSDEEAREKEEKARKDKEAPIVIFWHGDKEFSCERSDDKVCFDDLGELTKHVARLLAWRRDEPEDLRYSPTAEELVGALIQKRVGNSLEIPFDLKLVTDREPDDELWTKNVKR